MSELTPGLPWPAVHYETLPWPSRLEPGMSSRSQLRRHQGPYEAAVTAPIATTAFSLPAALAASLDDATSEIARFDADLGDDLTPFAAVLLRSESAASSQIENLTASARAIGEAEIDAEEDPEVDRIEAVGTARRPRTGGNAAQVVANSRAMAAAIALADTLDEDAILAMHAALMSKAAPEIAGRWRTEQVWIGGGDVGPHEARFVPPWHERVPGAIADLVTFLDRDNIPVLAHAAIAHAQFETIHPFPDGNGRTGRALVHSLLRAKRLTRAVTVPVSAGLLVDVDAYFDALTAYRSGDAGPIVERFVTAAFAATTNGRRLAQDLRDIRAHWQTVLKVDRRSGAWRLLDVLTRQPVVNSATVAAELGVGPTNVYGPVNALITAGILLESTNRKRGKVWRAPEVITALDAFAARAGRRSLPRGS